MAENSLRKRILGAAIRLFRVILAWTVKFSKTKFMGCKLCKAKKNMNEKVERLGTEIYSMHKQGETEFLKSTAVLQQLKLVEEAEARLFEVYDRIEAIDNDYRRKKQQIAQSGKPEQPSEE